MNYLAPIIILGVPRSGTTLLRVILGSHSTIHATAESPWITGGYGENSIRHLLDHLNNDQAGPVHAMPGVTQPMVTEAGRRFVDTLLVAAQGQSGKPRLLLKTPDDAGRLDFLRDFFPDSAYIHICRDGRDVACSTVEKRDSYLGETLPGYGRLTLGNALQRWCDWESAIREFLKDSAVKTHLSIRYEDLVTEPEPVVRQICQTLAIAYEPAMLSYAKQEHVLPKWEAGAQDVAKRPQVVTSSLGRWKQDIAPGEMRWIDERFGEQLAALGYKRCRDEVDLARARFTWSAAQIRNSRLGDRLRTARNLTRLIVRIPRRIFRETAHAVERARNQ